MTESTEKVEQSLVFRAGRYLCALPLRHVVETMRPLPIEPVTAAPPFVRGVSLIRGEALPVVDVARLLGIETTHPTRFVTIRVAERRIALSVDVVVGVRAIDEESVPELAPLLDSANAEMIAGIAERDGALLVVLRSARLVPESMWRLIDLVEMEAQVLSS